jgi:hypothetical protein
MVGSLTLQGMRATYCSLCRPLFDLAGPVAEQVLLLENIATSIQTGPNQLPTIHNLLLEAVSSIPSGRVCGCSPASVSYSFCFP